MTDRIHVPLSYHPDKDNDIHIWLKQYGDRNRSEAIRHALRMHIKEGEMLQGISEQLDRVEDTLERCLRLLEEEQK